MSDDNRKGRGSDTGAGRVSKKSGNVQYTRVIPKFLQNLVHEEDTQYDTFKVLPNSNSSAKAAGEAVGNPAENELDLLRREGFAVDAVVEAAAPPDVGAAHGVAQQEGGDPEIMPKQKLAPPAKNTAMKVAAHRIAKPAASKRPQNAFATKNQTKLSFQTTSDDDDDGSSGENN